MINFYKIPSHQNYSISETGEVRNDKTGRILKHTAREKSGYFTVYVDGKNRLLHRLLAETFLPNPDKKPCINHKDGNKQNNSLDNLEYCTYAENLIHARKTGLNPYQILRGENSRHHKLTKDDVDYIRQNYKAYDSEFGAKPLSKLFGVTSSCICSIVRDKSWRVVS